MNIGGKINYVLRYDHIRATAGQGIFDLQQKAGN